LAAGNIDNFAVPAQLSRQQLAPGFSDLAESGLPRRNLLVYKLSNSLVQPDGAGRFPRFSPLDGIA
jgi:hypothetical protein